MEEKEISFIDLIIFLKRRKKIIISFAVIITAAALLFGVLKPQTYTGSIIIEMGMVGFNLKNTSSVEVFNDVTNKIMSGVYGVKNLKATNYPTTKIINIEGKSTSAEKIKQDLENTVNLVISESQKIFDEKNKFYTEDVERLNLKTNLLEKEKKSIEDRLSYLEKVGIYQQSSTYMLSYLDDKKNLAQVNDKLDNLESKTTELKRSIDDLALTKIIKPISVEKNDKKILFTTIVGFFLGTFLGLIFAGAKEWWEKNKKELNK